MKYSGDTEFDFGPYKGMTLRQITECLAFYDKPNLISTTYFGRLMKVLSTNKDEYDIPLPESLNDEKVTRNSYTGVRRKVLDKPILFCDHVFRLQNGRVVLYYEKQLTQKETDQSNIWKMFRHTAISGSRFFGTYSYRDKPLFNENELKCFSDHQFISWAVRKVSKFKADETFMNSIFKRTELKSIKLDFDQIATTSEMQFIANNLQKNVYKNNLLVVKVNPIFISFDHKFYHKTISANKNKLAIPARFERQKYSYQSGASFSKSGNWLIDAAGSDDPELMEDVYWNLD